MPRDLGPNLTPETTTQTSADRWIWLVACNVGASEIVRFTTDNANVTWDSATYYAYPMTTPSIPEQTGTQAGTLELSIGNVDQIATDRLRSETLQGQTVTLTLVHSAHLSDTIYPMQIEAMILSAVVTRDGVTFTLGRANWIQRTLGRRFLRLRCHHVYGSAACGYDVDRSGALAACARTYDDCDVHGADEVAAGLVRLHPLRFGGFPTLPRANRG